MSEKENNSMEPPDADAQLVAAGMSPTWEKIKFIAGKVLKWAAIGALIGAVGLTVMGGMAGFGVAQAGVQTGGGIASTVGGVIAGVARLGWPGAIAAAGLTAVAGFFGYSYGADAAKSALGAAANGIGWAMGLGLATGGLLGAAFGAIGGLIAGFSGADANNEMLADKVEENKGLARVRQETAMKVAQQRMLQDAAYEAQLRRYNIDPNANRNLPTLDHAGRAMG